LLGIDGATEQIRVARAVVDGGFSVRDTEALIRGEGPAAVAIRPTEQPRRKISARKPLPSTADARRVEDALRTRLGTDIRLTARRKGRGTLAISYYSNDDLARILELILGQPFDG
jgi:ParB family chromosome partitioning protein